MNNFELNEKIEEFVDMYTPYQLAKMYLRTKEANTKLFIKMIEDLAFEINNDKELYSSIQPEIELLLEKLKV